MKSKYAEKKYTTSGNLIARLTHTLAQERNWSMVSRPW